MASNNEVSLKDVYEIVQRLEDNIDKRLVKVEEKTTKLEGFQNKALGIISVLSLFFSAMASFVWEKIVGKGS